MRCFRYDLYAMEVTSSSRPEITDQTANGTRSASVMFLGTCGEVLKFSL